MSQIPLRFNHINRRRHENADGELAIRSELAYLTGPMDDLPQIPSTGPVLIAGPTASGKSELAMRIAAKSGGVVINADAIQVFANWHILTARPSVADLARIPHRLYGHVPGHAPYSVGHWLREMAPLLDQAERPIIVGGTGLYFSALTEGLAEIPAVPSSIRNAADERLVAEGPGALLCELDAATRARIDTLNPARVQRAWEVQAATGRGLAAWQDETPPPALAVRDCTPLVIDAPKAWLTPRIEQRFDRMIAQGALDEVRANLPGWDPAHPSAKAIGARELVAHLRGETSLDQARAAATVATRQYAKRQRSWFRSRMSDWLWITPPQCKNF